MVDDRPAWARRIAAERVARGWSEREAVRRLRAHAAAELLSEDSMVRRWKRWEQGEMPDGFCRPVVAALFGTVTHALFPAPSRRDGDREVLAASGMETPEIVRRLERSDIDGATLDALRVTADRLASEYPVVPGERLLVEGRQWLRRVVALNTSSLTSAQRREVLAVSGRLALLVGCAEYDTGAHHAAESTRQAALSLAAEAGHAEIAGWAHEMRAWFALTDGDYRGVVAAARAGAERAPNRGVAVQLAAQEAKAWARLGERRRVEAALDEGRRLLERMPYPENPENHFVVDPAKFDFYAMDCYRLVGEDRLARLLAEEVLRAGTDADGTERSPMRNAEARVTLAVTAARAGDLEQALALGVRALEGDRRSVPSLVMTGGELAAELKSRYGTEPGVRDYLARMRRMRRMRRMSLGVSRC
ncbi:XRE family transcriptional regulator [Streptomyces sp. ISL-12]|uniref:XRE family transcriptional regulator n=1 Tax=Streptomyces sp. ISL-12 TaxID=2819177 RepID=UPI001BE9C059|nr:XRE family transcriptional regulator [Streptomyces sp. ISL-12]MBT2411595.1 XRE family transcriptional regulator [Streptomyces sp. ISL-12]